MKRRVLTAAVITADALSNGFPLSILHFHQIKKKMNQTFLSFSFFFQLFNTRIQNLMMTVHNFHSFLLFLLKVNKVWHCHWHTHTYITTNGLLFILYLLLLNINFYKKKISMKKQKTRIFEAERRNRNQCLWKKEMLMEMEMEMYNSPRWEEKNLIKLNIFNWINLKRANLFPLCSCHV